MKLRIFLFVITVLSPGLGWAQLFGNSFGSGSYVLNDSRSVRQQGQLLFRRARGGRFTGVAEQTVTIERFTPEA